jgi:hypothetical protein
MSRKAFMDEGEQIYNIQAPSLISILLGRIPVSWCRMPDPDSPSKKVKNLVALEQSSG